MLLKEFSHIITNTNLPTQSPKDLGLDVETYKSTTVHVNTITSDNQELSYYAINVSDLILYYRIDDSSQEESEETNDNNESDLQKYKHYSLQIDQTSLQTRLMGKYIQVLCAKYDINEEDIDFNISPIVKNNKPWLVYTFKFPTLTSADSIELVEFKNYIDKHEEYTISGYLYSGNDSDIRIYIINSNEITSASEAYAALRANMYDLLNRVYHSGDQFTVNVKYGYSILFQADYCKDVILIGVSQNVNIKEIKLGSTDELDNNKNNLIIVQTPQLSNKTTYTYTYDDKQYQYQQNNYSSLEFKISSLDTDTYSKYNTNKVSFGILAASHYEETSEQAKDWVVIKEYPKSEILKIQKEYVINDNTITTLLNKITIPESLFNEYVNHQYNNYVSSFYLKPALIYKEDEDHTSILNENVFNNIVTIECKWINNELPDITSLKGSGDRLIISIKNTSKVHLNSVPKQIENAFIYDTDTGLTSDIPNLLIPCEIHNLNYLQNDNNDSWLSYNGYLNNLFKTRTLYCRGNNIYTHGEFPKYPISFTIEYTSYFVDPTSPKYFYLIDLDVDDTSLTVTKDNKITNNDSYDIKHKLLHFKNIRISNLTEIKLNVTINRYQYFIDINGNVINKDSDGSYTENGDLVNIDTTTGIMYGKIGFDDNSKYYMLFHEGYLTSDRTFKFVDDSDTVLQTKSTADNFIYDSYGSIECNHMYLIKKYFISANNIEKDNEHLAIQNIFPSDADHINVYNSLDETLGKIYFDEYSNLKNTDNPDDALFKFGGLSDIHFAITDISKDPDASDNRQSHDDLQNALRYFNENGISIIFSAGDLSASSSPQTPSTSPVTDEDTDLIYFKRSIDTLLSPYENMKFYIARGNHDAGSILNKINLYDPNSDNVYDMQDDALLLNYDETWINYLPKDPENSLNNIMNWQYGYYIPGNTTVFDEDPNNDDTGIYYNEDLKSLSCGYNVYYLGGTKENNDYKLRLVVISLPVYSEAFWSGNSPAFVNKEIYYLEKLIRKFYKQDRTEIIIFTHMPFNNATGNYKRIYGRWGMRKWYDHKQYILLEKLHDAYKGIIWIEGHTHIIYEMQGYKTSINTYRNSYNSDTGERIIGDNSYITYDDSDYFDNSNISCINNVFDIHLSSCAYPRKLNDAKDGLTDIRLASQGSLFEVYEDHMIIKCITFKMSGKSYVNSIVPIAMYKLNFLKNKPDVTTPVLQYVWRRTTTIDEETNIEYDILEEYTDGYGNADQIEEPVEEDTSGGESDSQNTNTPTPGGHGEIDPNLHPITD